MKELLFSSGESWTGLVLRVVLGAIMLPHGAQKLLGWFGGYGFKASMDFFTGSMNLPWIIGITVILAESFGAIGLMVGFATRIWAVALFAIMIGAIVTTNIKNGFFMNWFGNQSGEGYEYHLLIAGICVAIILTGGGKYSIDNLIQTGTK